MLHTWPLAAAPAHWSRVDPGDGALNIWAIGWVGHSLLHNPTQLFNANIFYPEKQTLAYSEAMLVQGAVAAPVLALGGSAVLAYNVSMLAGLASTGWAFCLLVRRWTGSWSAGYVAGSLAAFNAHSLVQLTHMQFLHTEFFALMLFALDRLIVTGRFRHVWSLAAGFALQGLTSVYLLVFSVWTLLFAIASRIREWWAAGPVAMVARFAAAGAIAVILLSPYLAEYYLVRDRMGFTRTADEAEAASWVNYLSTGSRVHFETWSKPFTTSSTSFTFPGFAALALVVVAWSDRANIADPRFRMCATVAAGCIAVSLAPRLPFYPVLHAAIPLFQAVRALAHVGQVVLMMIAVLAGFGVATLQRAWGQHAGVAGRRHRTTDSCQRRSVPRADRLHLVRRHPADLRRAGEGAQRGGGRGAIPNAAAVVPEHSYMVNSTRHWRPLLNGYSGFRPAWYYEAYETMREFPSDRSLIALFQRGVTHIVIHKKGFAGALGEARMKELSSVSSLQYVAQDDDILIYRLLRP